MARPNRQRLHIGPQFVEDFGVCHPGYGGWHCRSRGRSRGKQLAAILQFGHQQALDKPGSWLDNWLGGDLMFRPAYHCEDWLGVETNESHEVFRWSERRVFFSCCEKGEALSAHFSADRSGIRQLKAAIDEFCGWAFASMPWCRMIFACIVRPSVTRLVVKCGFSFLGILEDLQIYVRYR